MITDLAQFEEKIGVAFPDQENITIALTHRSYLNEREGKGLEHNERMEFLGDAVLELVVTEFLYAKFPDEKEGILTAYRASMVNTKTLGKAAGDLEMDTYLRMSKGERMETEKGREHILANTFESVVGAIYLDHGYEKTKEFIANNLFVLIDEIIEKGLFRDPKSYFQEMTQEEEKITPHYELVSDTGPDHDKVFVMAVYIGEEKIAEGEGASKQKAEIAAARAALDIKGW